MGIPTVCPVDGRRTIDEPAKTLVVATVTVAVAYLHLQHTYLSGRDAWTLGLKLLAVVMMPTCPTLLAVWGFVGVAHALLIASPIDIVMSESDGTVSNERTDSRSWTVLALCAAQGPLLVWTLPPPRPRQLDTPDPAPARQIECRSDERLIVARVCHLAVMAFAVIQLTATVVLSARRMPRPGAMILTDWRIFWTSLSGLMITIQSIGPEILGIRLKAKALNEIASASSTFIVCILVLFTPAMILNLLEIKKMAPDTGTLSFFDRELL